MKFLVKFLVTLIIIAVIAIISARAPKDSTDPPNGRSGMGLRIDHATGCHYLTSAGLFGETSITPRLRPDGSHYCDPR